MKVTVLGSGSKGNAAYVDVDGIHVLVDAGLSYRQLKRRAAAKGMDIDALDAVLVTHEHNDHVAGLDMLMRHTAATLYATPATMACLPSVHAGLLGPSRCVLVTPDEPFRIRTLDVCARRVSHDASETVGYVVEASGKKLVYMTDVGFLSTTEYQRYADADIYVFEANYDAAMLFSSARPHHLKRRIDSVKGHMSNHDSAYHMSRLIGPRTKTVVLAHPSQECNTPEHALKTYEEIFTAYGLRVSDYKIVVANQYEPVGPFEV